jgi:hypothetical protein
MLNTEANSEIPATRSHGRATRSHKRYNQKKRPPIPQTLDRCRFNVSFWTHSMRSIIMIMTSSEVSQSGRIEERRFGGFSTRFLSLVIRYHIKARSVNRLFCQFRVHSRAIGRSRFHPPDCHKLPHGPGSFARPSRLCEKFLELVPEWLTWGLCPV